MIVYVAVLKDSDCSVDQVLTVQTKFDAMEAYVKDYFGINPDKTYTNPGRLISYTEIEYSEVPDDLHGYYTFEDMGEMYEVYVFMKGLDEKP